jgi:hypothetical protein
MFDVTQLDLLKFFWYDVQVEDDDVQVEDMFQKIFFLFGGIPHLNTLVVRLVCIHGCTGVVAYIFFFNL